MEVFFVSDIPDEEAVQYLRKKFSPSIKDEDFKRFVKEVAGGRFTMLNLAGRPQEEPFESTCNCLFQLHEPHSPTSPTSTIPQINNLF